MYDRAFSIFDVLEINQKWLGHIGYCCFISSPGGECLRQTLHGTWSDVLKPRKDDYAMGEHKSKASGIRYSTAYSVECLHDK